jgi:hypothetical protein
MRSMHRNPVDFSLPADLDNFLAALLVWINQHSPFRHDPTGLVLILEHGTQQQLTEVLDQYDDPYRIGSAGPARRRYVCL